MLTAAARFGPYFAWEPWDGDPRWRPLTDLLDPAVAAERVAVARGVLVRMSRLTEDAIPERVVASVTFLGLASRLLSPLLAVEASGGSAPALGLSDLWWRAVESGPIPIAWQSTAPPEGDAVRRGVDDLVTPLLEVYRHRFALSGQVLWGNVASALGGAATMIAAAEPWLARRSAEVVGEALSRPPLRGMAALRQPDPSRERWSLTRNNCCLYYRIPGGGTCGDCVLNRR